MERPSRGTRDALLRRLFPGLDAGRDPELGRYFRLRAEGRTSEALGLFNRVLKVRYPDDEKRTTLFNLLRRSDPGFPEFHDRLLWDLFESASARIRDTLDRICGPLSELPPRDPDRLLGALDEVFHLLPEGREAARKYLEDHSALADLLGYRVREMRTVRARAAAWLEPGSAGPPPGLSRADLDPRDLARIEAPPDLDRPEDRVLALCLKYWTASEDPAFRRKVLLLSLRRGTPHYDVLRTIRSGRASGLPGPEILRRTLSVWDPDRSRPAGDPYLRKAWEVLRSRLPPEDRVARVRPGREDAGTAEAPGAPAPADRKPPKPREPGPRTPRAAGTTRVGNRRGGSTAGKPPAPGPTPRGSVSDRIKVLSGRRYDVYREEFLARVGPSIRDWLADHRIKPKDVFEDPLGRAEDLVREFLERNYANPYMDWQGSDTRARVEGLGFSVPELDGIIALWYVRRGR